MLLHFSCSLSSSVCSVLMFHNKLHRREKLPQSHNKVEAATHPCLHQFPLFSRKKWKFHSAKDSWNSSRGQLSPRIPLLLLHRFHGRAVILREVGKITVLVIVLLPVHVLLAMVIPWFHQTLLLLVLKVFLREVILFTVFLGVKLLIMLGVVYRNGMAVLGKEACGRLSLAPWLRLNADRVGRTPTFLCLPRV